MKLQNKQALVIFGFGVLFLSAVSLVYYFHSRQKKLESIHAFMRSIVEHEADEISGFLSEKVKLALTLANNSFVIESLNKSNAEFDALTMTESARKKKIEQLNKRWVREDDVNDPFVRSYLDNNVGRYFRMQQEILSEEYGEIFLTNRYGLVVGTSGKLTTLAHAHKYWWIAAYDDGRGRVFLDDRGFDTSVGGYVLGIVVPIKEDDRIIGILKCNLNILSLLNGFVESFKKYKTGVLKIVRSGGTIIYEEGKEPLSTAVSHVLVGEMEKRRNGSVEIEEKDGSSCIVAFNPVKITLGSEAYGFGGSYESLGHIKGNKCESWYLILSQKRKILLSGIRTTVRWILFSDAVFIVCMAVIALLLGKRTALPVVKLVENVKKIGAGDFNTIVESSSNDEVGVLADSFNEMTKNLREARFKRNQEAEKSRMSEVALMQSEEKFRTFFEKAGDAIFVTDTETGYIIDCNHKAENLIGKTREEIIGMHQKDLHPHRANEDDGDSFKKHLSAGGATDFEAKILHKDGRIVPVSISAQVMEMQGKKVMMGIFTDITERKKAEEALKRSEEKYKRLIEASTDAIVVFDAETKKFVEVNTAAEHLYGYSRKEFLALRQSDITNEPEDSDETIKKTLKGEQTKIPLRYHKKNDGTIFPVEISFSFFTVRGRTLLCGIIRDITERLKAANEIKEERNKLQSVIGAMQQGLTIQDLDYNITYQNDLLLKLFGNHPGEKCYAIYEGQDHVCDGCPVEMAFKDGQQHTALRKVTMSSGKTAYWENTANPIRDAGGKIISCLEITQEVTKQMEAEEEKEKFYQQIIQSEKMASLGEMAGGLAHELNTPLNVILGYQEFMKKKIEKCPEFKEYVDISIEEVEFCRDLIIEFLMFAQPAQEEISSMHSVDIKQVISSVMKLVPGHKEKGINIKLDSEEKLPLVKGNQKHLKQVFLNLLNNSIYAMPEGRDITISVKHIQKNNEGIIEFRVTDTGEGIPKEIITKVFDPFFTTKRPGKGTGLGLAVCQRIMENHKGTIRIESEPGKETTVIGQLPV